MEQTGAPMRWFRLYNDIVDDEKIAQIDPKTFKIFVFLMSICSQNDSQNGILPDKKFLSWRMRISDKKLEMALGELEGAGIVNRANGAIVLVNWHKRQFKSDNVTERVNRFRKAQKDKNETLHETLNVSSQNRTDTEQIQNIKNIPPLPPKGERAKFSPPSLDEVRAYIKERGYAVNPDGWFSHYEANGWMVGKNKMKNWRAAIGTWQHNGYGRGEQVRRRPDPGESGREPSPPPKPMTPEEEREQEIRELKQSIHNAETFLASPGGKKDARASAMVRDNLDRFTAKLKEMGA